MINLSSYQLQKNFELLILFKILQIGINSGRKISRLFLYYTFIYIVDNVYNKLVK